MAPARLTAASPALALAALSIQLLARAAVQDHSVPLWWQSTDEFDYLANWQEETYGDSFPEPWWYLVPTCPNGTTPGMSPGLTCAAVGEGGQQLVVEVDLSPQSVPPGSHNLSGRLQKVPFIVGLRHLSRLNLASTGLKGYLPGYITLAPRLTGLILSDNSLHGPLSEELCSLKCLNVANNSLSGRIPECLHWLPCVDLAGNNFTRSRGDCNASARLSSCEPSFWIPPRPPEPAGPASIPVGAAVGIAVGCLALLALGATCLVLLLRHMHARKAARERQLLVDQVEAELGGSSFGALKRFSAEAIAAACCNYASDYCIGKGGSSVVYKGILEDATEVAIKRMQVKMRSAELPRELRFLREVEVISRASHRHLVTCLGFCIQPGEDTCLVLRYYPHGSVASRTQGMQGSLLTWDARMRIAKGAAVGLAYLHHDCQPPILHGDIKPENVLLDEQDEAVIADFGLAREMEEGENPADGQGLRGTLGHLAPEYFQQGIISPKTDVYAFGIFLLELVSGKNIFELTSGAECVDKGVHQWLRDRSSEDQVLDLFDPELASALDGQEPWEGGLSHVLHVAEACMMDAPEERPDMGAVVDMLLSGGSPLARSWAAHLPEDLTSETDGTRDLTDAGAWDEMTTGVVMRPMEEIRKSILARSCI